MTDEYEIVLDGLPPTWLQAIAETIQATLRERRKNRSATDKALAELAVELNGLDRQLARLEQKRINLEEQATGLRARLAGG